MKKSEIKEVTSEVHAIERGEIAPARVREVTILPGGAMRRVELDPETYRRKQARAWKAKTEAAKVRHELDLTQQDCIRRRFGRRWRWGNEMNPLDEVRNGIVTLGCWMKVDPDRQAFHHSIRYEETTPRSPARFDRIGARAESRGA